MDKLRIAWFSVLFFLFSVGSAQESDFDEWLELDLSELMNIKVTTATKKDQLIQKVPATVRIITANQIKERAYHSLENVLQDLPGFQFRDILSFNAYSFLRGAPSQNNLILVLVDGIQINELNSGGFYGGYQYNLQNVKQIEVVYGPSSALYGTNAVSGIINIITKDPEDQPQTAMALSSGTFGTLMGNCSYRYYSEKSPISASISAFYNQTEKADLGGAAGDWNWSANMENFENDFGFDSKIIIKNNTRIGLTFQDKHSSQTTYYKSVGTSILDSGTDWHIRFFNAYLSNLYSKSPGWSLKSQMYYRNATVMDNTITLIDTTPGIGQVGYYRPNSLVGLEEQIDYEFSSNANLVTGIVLEAEKLAVDFSKTYSGDPYVTPPTPAEPKFEKNTLVSIFAQSQYKFFNYTEAIAGFRWDNSSYYGNVITPRLGIVYDRGLITTKLLYTEAFRAPKPWDYHWGYENPDLAPERMKSIELANIFSPTKHLRIDISVYKNQIYNKLTIRDSTWINADWLNTAGLETNLEYGRNRTQFYLNYAYTDSRYSDGSVVPEIAHHSLNAGINYSFLKNLNINLRGNYLGRRKNPVLISATNSNYIDAYFVLNGVINYNPTPKIELQAAIDNILDACYYHTSNRPPERYRQPQRTLIFKFGYQI